MFFLRDIRIPLVAFCALLSVFYVLSAGGCGESEQIVKETNEPHFVRGRKELGRGNNAEAMSEFMKVVEKRRDAPESHFELGRLYLDHINDPIQAIYHFKKFLELKPASPVSPMVTQMIETAQKKFAASLPETPFDNNIKRLELQEIVDSLRKQNLELKKKLAEAIEAVDALKATQTVKIQRAPSRVESYRAQASLPRRTQVQENQVPTVRRDAPKTYTVQAGDTLSTISRKVYGTKNRWREIFAANRDRLATPESLRIGQTLKIPQ